MMCACSYQKICIALAKVLALAASCKSLRAKSSRFTDNFYVACALKVKEHFDVELHCGSRACVFTAWLVWNRGRCRQQHRWKRGWKSVGIVALRAPNPKRLLFAFDWLPVSHENSNSSFLVRVGDFMEDLGREQQAWTAMLSRGEAMKLVQELQPCMWAC